MLQIKQSAAPLSTLAKVRAALRRWKSLDTFIWTKYPSQGVFGLLSGFDPQEHRCLNEDQTHFPEDGWTDSSDGSHAFFHRHQAPRVQAGHFHVFRGEVHLASLALDWRTVPVEICTLNRWVTGERWQPAAATWGLFRTWGRNARGILRSRRSPARDPETTSPVDAALLGAWIEALIHSLEPELRECLRARDRQLAREIDRKPGVNVLEDHSLEVLSRCKLRWSERLAWDPLCSPTDRD